MYFSNNGIEILFPLIVKYPNNRNTFISFNSTHFHHIFYEYFLLLVSKYLNILKLLIAKDQFFFLNKNSYFDSPIILIYTRITIPK
jgi:hypothetical protein